VTSEHSNLEIVDRSGGRATARLSGDLDIVTSEEVKRELAQLIDDGHSVLALDLSGVGFVDSSGLGVLVAAHRHATSSPSTATPEADAARGQRSRVARRSLRQRRISRDTCIWLIPSRSAISLWVSSS
jgi:ABC-type transporter Mla MlaB component